MFVAQLAGLLLQRRHSEVCADFKWIDSTAELRVYCEARSGLSAKVYSLVVLIALPEAVK